MATANDPAVKQRPRVVILGGGFGGLTAIQALRKAPVDVVLIDRRNHHLFQPLLYQVATAALNPSNIASPIRRIVRNQKNATVLMAEATSVDTKAKKVILADGEVSYDYLIIATGASHAYFGHDDWEDDAPGLKTIEDALAIRRKVLIAFEEAEREPDSARRLAWQTFVVVGGGPTGVELAGSLIEIARHVVSRDFRRTDPTRARVILVEGGPRILSAYPPDLSLKARTQLEHLGVEVREGEAVTDINAEGVTTGAGHIASKTVLWAAGVAASPLGKTLGVPLDRAGRVLVGQDLTIPEAPDVFVIGDLASLTQDGKPVPGVAPAAMQGGRYAADCIVKKIKGQPCKPFRYVDKGSLATIGRASAVAQIGKIHLSGMFAWLAWLLIHVFFLIGFRNRLLVMGEWAWIYMTYERGARLITGERDRRDE